MAHAWQKIVDLHLPGHFWHLFQALRTPGFEEMGQFAKGVLGIKDWSEVRHGGPVSEE